MVDILILILSDYLLLVRTSSYAVNSYRINKTPYDMFAFKAVRALASRSAHAVQRTAVQHFGHAQVRAMSARPRLELTEAEADPEIALTNLLYNHPTEEAEVDVEGQIVSLLVEDEPGVLSRTSSLLSGRGYNIKSLSVYVFLDVHTFEI